METDSYITIDLKGFLTMLEWRFKIAFHWTKKWSCTNLLLANYMATATLDYLFFQYKMPFFTDNILYYVERGSIFQWSLSFHGCRVEWKEIIKCPVAYPEFGGGGMKRWWLSKTFVWERYVQMSSFCWIFKERSRSRKIRL